MFQGAFLKWVNLKFSFFFLLTIWWKMFMVLFVTLYLTAGVGYIFFNRVLKLKHLYETRHWSLPFVNFTVSIVSVVFAIAGEKNDPVLPAHIFVLCSKTLNQQHASMYWIASLEGKTPLDTSTPSPRPNIQAVRLRLDSIFLYRRMLLACLSPPMKPVCDDACSGTSCHILPLVFFPYVHVSIL